MAVKILMLSKAKAAEYLGCSLTELQKWIKPDRTGDDRNPAAQGMRLGNAATLDAAKPHIEEWRERDSVAAEQKAHESARVSAAAAARQKGMRKGGALLAGKVCDALECTLTGLNRWAEDGRLPPDGLPAKAPANAAHRRNPCRLAH